MKKEIIVVFCILVMLFCLPRQSVNAAELFELHLLNVEQGQAALIEADGLYMMFDGGGRHITNHPRVRL